MTSSSLPPPGWYGDPAGSHGSRWWDGTAWTDHVRAETPNDDPPPAPGALDAAPDAALPPSMSRRGRLTAVIGSVALVVGLAATAVIGLQQDTGPESVAANPLDRDEVADRSDAAGCALTVDGEPMEDRNHVDPADAPPADVLYPQRPAHSGRHYGSLMRLPQGVSDTPIDERAVLHNMEHGAVVVWFDPGAVPGRAREQIAAWRDARADLGFVSRNGGGVFASPMPDVADAPPLALRAWGVALDCERFDPIVADAFLVDHWGSHGAAPEAERSPYPDGALRYRDTP